MQVQPGPEAAIGPAPSAGLLISAVRPAGSGLATVTVPLVGSAPALRTVSVSVPECGVVFGGVERRNVARACVAVSVSSGAATRRRGAAEIAVTTGTRQAAATAVHRVLPSLVPRPRRLHVPARYGRVREAHPHRRPDRADRARRLDAADRPDVRRPRRHYRFGWGTSSDKLAGPAIAAADLPPLDAILLSHDHHDDNLDPAGRALLPAGRRGRHDRVGREAAGLRPRPRRLGGTTLEAPGKPPLEIIATPCRHGPPLSHPLVGDVIGFALVCDGTVVWVSRRHRALRRRALGRRALGRSTSR